MLWVLDHIVPKCKGGRDGLDNMAVACWMCNSIKSGNTVAWMRNKLGVIAAEKYGWFVEALRIS